MAQIKPWVPLSNKKLRTIGLSSAKARAESFFIRELNGAREKNGLGWDLFTFLLGKIRLPIMVRLFSLFDGLRSAAVDSTHRYASSDEDSLSTSHWRSPYKSISRGR